MNKNEIVEVSTSGSLSNRIGEDLFPASKMKWGFFNNGCIQCAEADFQSYGSHNSYVLSS